MSARNAAVAFHLVHDYFALACFVLYLRNQDMLAGAPVYRYALSDLTLHWIRCDVLVNVFHYS